MNYRPLFITGPARSGSTLLTRMLAAHPEIMAASDPYFPLMRSLRNAIVRASADSQLRSSFDPTSPLQDYYFTDERIHLLDVIQAGTLEIRFEDDEWVDLHARLVARAEAESADLVPHLNELCAETYKAVFDKALDLIATVRDSATRTWIGFKEVWTIEFFRVLAGSYPAARFVVLMRDPRAVVWSMLALAERDPTQFAHTLSYARHWRKYSAFITRYEEDPLFQGRIFVVRYEDLIEHPRAEAGRLCSFLDVPFDDAMLDSGRYIDSRTKTPWTGNSSFASAEASSRNQKSWRESMDEALITLLDLTCGAETELFGYETVNDNLPAWKSPSVVRYLREQDRLPCSWRSDLGNPDADYSAELRRRALLAGAAAVEDENAIRRNFLFPEQFSKLIRCKLSAPTSTFFH
jgi:hypothetical protein